MSSGITITNSAFDHALMRLMSTSKKAAVDVMKDEARRLFVEVGKVTPPAGGAKGNTLQGLKAEKAGKAAIVHDYHEIYGTPSRAYDDLKAKSTEDRADAFWASFKNGRLDAAQSIVRADLGKSLSPFDGGRAAKAYRGKQRKKEALFYITDTKPFQAAIEEAQSHVWYLASGWADALKALGVKRLPFGMNKQNGPGLLRVIVTDRNIEITMRNEVSYARRVKGLQDQIDFAIRVRVGKLDRAWDEYLKKLAREVGLKAK